MRLLEIAREYLDLCVSGAGAGIKSMLLDAEAMSTVSIAYPQSKLMAKGVYLFEKLEDHRSKEVLPFVTCVVLVSPKESNVALLKAEISAPRFGRYHLCFTGHLANSAIKVLAEVDTQEVVASVTELPLAFRPLDNHLFLGGRPPVVAAICSVVDCLDVKPQVCHAKASDACRALSEQLCRHWRSQGRISSGPGPAGAGRSSVLVFVFDRRLDPVTPLLNQWTYQAMIHEAFGIRNNVVQLGAREDAKAEKVTISADDDEFFKANMYKNFGEIGEVIRTLVASYQDKVATHQRSIDSVADIKEFISNYPEFQKMSGTVSKHVNLLGEISKFVTANGLLDVSECEQSLANKEDAGVDVAGFLQSHKDMRRVDVLRILCLLFINRELRMHLESQEVNVACKAHGIPRREIECLFRNLRDFAMLDCLSSSSKLNQLRSGQATTELIRSSGRKIFRGLRGTENVFTQHEPVISQILSSLTKTGQSSAVNFDTTREGNGAFKNIIIYISGGATYEEAKAIRDLNASLGCNIVLGGDVVWRSADFVQSFLQEK